MTGPTRKTRDRLAAQRVNHMERVVELNNLLATPSPEEEERLQQAVGFLARHSSPPGWDAVMTVVRAAVRYGTENAADLEDDHADMPDPDYERAFGPRAAAARRAARAQ